MTRLWRVKVMADQIRQLETNDLKLDLVLIVDNIGIPKSSIYRCFKDFSYALEYTEKPLPSEGNVAVRRERIASNMNRARELVGKTDFVFMLEDDTDFDPWFLQHLIAQYKPDRGIISAVQAGRHGLHHIGAWETDDLKYPTVFETVPYKAKGIRQVDATGFYCCIMRTDLFKRVPVPCEILPVGPDVQYGIELRKQGYRNLLYDDLKCGHVEEHRVVLPTEDCMQVRFRKNGDRWDLTQ